MTPLSNMNWYNLSNQHIVLELCNELKKMRLSKNWSQGQLAEHAGLDRVTISRMENGRAVTLLTLVQVLRSLDQLEVLYSFISQPAVSPLRALAQQKNERKKASPQPKK
jgi:transcriptional regulator with XRE-family HTH domain